MKLDEIENIANINYGTRVVKKRDSGTIYDVYGGGGKTFKVDSFNRENCVIVSRFGMSEECVRRVDGKFFLNDSGLSVETKDPNVVIQKYIDWFLFSKMFDIYLLGRGAAQKNLDVDKFRLIKIQVPSHQEQEKIVEKTEKVFENISKKIQLTEEKIIEMNTIFTSFLNKIINNHLKESNMKSLDKLFNIQIGRTPPRADKKLWDTKKTTNNIWLSIKDLNNIDENGFISDSFEYISKKAESSVPLVPKNTLLLSFKLTLGRTAISKVPVRTNEAIAALLPKTNTYNINYLKYYFEYFDFIKFAKNDFKVKGLTLNKKKLAEIKIPIIPLQEQNEAVKQLDQISNSVKTLISNYENQLLLLSNLKKSYLNKEFSYE